MVSRSIVIVVIVVIVFVAFAFVARSSSRSSSRGVVSRLVVDADRVIRSRSCAEREMMALWILDYGCVENGTLYS
tara:strand:+ start:113 stop:337 length:225 start_codon:yes stop_codon:yes gene_type:complete